MNKETDRETDRQTETETDRDTIERGEGREEKKEKKKNNNNNDHNNNHHNNNMTKKKKTSDRQGFGMSCPREATKRCTITTKKMKRLICLHWFALAPMTQTSRRSVWMASCSCSAQRQAVLQLTNPAVATLLPLCTKIIMSPWMSC